MAVAARLEAFHQALMQAVEKHAPEAHVELEEKRGILLEGRLDLDRDKFVAIYFNALTGKTSYALIWRNRRLAGYDNYKYWHYHPAGEVSRHVACAEPTPQEAVARLVEIGRATD